MRDKKEQSITGRIREFRARKAQEFPELELDVDACTDYENYHITHSLRFYNLAKQQIKHY